jgi:hypothetical protein
VAEGDICDADVKEGILVITGKNEAEKVKRSERNNNLFDKLKRRY